MKEAFWDINALEYNSGKYDVEFSPEKYRMELVLKYIDSQGINSILDVGSGTGELLGRCRGIDKKVGIDFSKKMVEVAKKSFSSIKFIHTSIEDFKINYKFDFITSLSVIPYVEDDKIAYKKIHNALSDEGVFIASYPNSLFNMFTNNNLTYDFMNNIFLNYLKEDKMKLEELSCIDSLNIAKFPEETARGKIFLREENPLEITSKMNAFGFSVEKILFLNIHPLKPVNMKKFNIDKKHELYKKLQVELLEDWRSNFLASTFMIIAKKQ